MKKNPKISKKSIEPAKAGRKRTFSMSLTTRPLKSEPDTVGIQFKIKLPTDLNGKKVSTGLRCPRDSLNAKTWEIKQNSVDTEILRTMRENVKRAYLESLSSGKKVKYEKLFDSAFGTQNNKVSVVQAIERFLSKEYLSEASDWKETTALKNQQRVAVLKEFFKDNFKNQVAYFEDLKPQTADDLVEWAKIKRQNSTYTAVRLVKFFKRVINFAIANEWTGHNPFLAFRNKNETNEIIALDDKEIEALINLPLTTKTMQTTRDLFVFCVFSCLSYAELENLKYGNISIINNHRTIILNRKKRGNSRAVVPMLPNAERILKQYEPAEIKDETPCFIVPSNQSCNRVLKELAGMAGINKVVKWHTARKSGATYLLNKGVPIEQIQKICGHKSVKVTEKYYATMHDETVIKAIQDIDFGSKN